MIQQNELRIGNVLDRENTGHSIVVTADHIFHWDKFKELLYPIQLTEYILLKCGFDEIDIEENKNNVRVFHLNGIYYNTSHGVYYFTHFLTKIKSVHELQNLYFALTGVELKIIA